MMMLSAWSTFFSYIFFLCRCFWAVFLSASFLVLSSAWIFFNSSFILCSWSSLFFSINDFCSFILAMAEAVSLVEASGCFFFFPKRCILPAQTHDPFQFALVRLWSTLSPLVPC